ncbi:MAG: hypothetical protein GMKNLPBB_00509 [Myxococcota bacterium]|nr:hypothetical protein [Myxococcota bacterium]
MSYRWSMEANPGSAPAIPKRRLEVILLGLLGVLGVLLLVEALNPIGVRVEGGVLNIRPAPNRKQPPLATVSRGAELVVGGAWVSAEGYKWRRILLPARYSGAWVAVEPESAARHPLRDLSVAESGGVIVKSTKSLLRGAASWMFDELQRSGAPVLAPLAAWLNRQGDKGSHLYFSASLTTLAIIVGVLRRRGWLAAAIRAFLMVNLLGLALEFSDWVLKSGQVDVADMLSNLAGALAVAGPVALAASGPRLKALGLALLRRRKAGGVHGAAAV